MEIKTAPGNPPPTLTAPQEETEPTYFDEVCANDSISCFDLLGISRSEFVALLKCAYDNHPDVIRLELAKEMFDHIAVDNIQPQDHCQQQSINQYAQVKQSLQYHCEKICPLISLDKTFESADALYLELEMNADIAIPNKEDFSTLFSDANKQSVSHDQQMVSMTTSPTTSQP